MNQYLRVSFLIISILASKLLTLIWPILRPLLYLYVTWLSIKIMSLMAREFIAFRSFMLKEQAQEFKMDAVEIPISLIRANVSSVIGELDPFRLREGKTEYLIEEKAYLK